MDGPDGDQEVVYEEFKEQLQRDSAKLGGMKLAYSGKLETQPLQNKKKVSLARLSELLRKLDKQPDLFSSYDTVIQDKIEQGIIEPVHLENDANPTFYLPQKPVIRETADSTKL